MPSYLYQDLRDISALPILAASKPYISPSPGNAITLEMSLLGNNVIYPARLHPTFQRCIPTPRNQGTNIPRQTSSTLSLPGPSKTSNSRAGDHRGLGYELSPITSHSSPNPAWNMLHFRKLSDLPNCQDGRDT